MKILHVPFSYFPDPVGGTEVYVRRLVAGLSELGIGGAIAAPTTRARDRYEVDGVVVHRYPTRGATTLDHVYGEGDAQTAAAFTEVLAASEASLVHLHAFTSGASLRVLRAAKAAGRPVVFTYHTPTVSCLRGDLLLDGEAACDGVLIAARCAACALGHLGAGAAARAVLSRIPPAIGRFAAQTGLNGRGVTAVRMTELARLRHATVRSVFSEADRIVAVSAWVRALLERNGVPRAKIVLSRHGIDDVPPEPAARERTDLLKLVFIGRFERVKGAHLLVEAVRRLDSAELRLDLYGVTQSLDDERYLHELRELASGDLRIKFMGALDPNEVVPRLAQYDLCLVPSQGLETGPLVVLEAFAAGTPVVGSDVGGVSELVRHGVDGILVEKDSPEAWRNVLGRLAARRELVAQLGLNVHPPRSMRVVADEMAHVYRELEQSANTERPAAMVAGAS